ncbi:DUF503 domain-containing protein [Hathewaya histolytica]|uniref:Ylxp-like protein n=1 Tax=Hathewaya histolytica TaxID=1498 RepID=A0A4U9RVF6_HATHI|nr:DUF503 domain-containing protein [Hathewaya histolytica]VTQ95636.1 ylxp-like protein [Hathewaya histolytica]
MFIGSAKVYMRANWCHSLKEKRMIVRSIVDKTKNKFNISIAEVENQDLHNSLVIGFACVSSNKKLVESMVNKVLDYIEGNTEAEIIDIETEIL